MPDTWKLEDKTFTKFILNDDIQAKICELSDRINTELAGKKPLFVVVLNGAFIFASDLLKRVTIDCEITFVKLSSYQGTMSTGVVQQIIGLDRDIKWADKTTKNRYYSASYELPEGPKGEPPLKGWIAFKEKAGTTFWVAYETHPNAWNAVGKSFQESARRMLITKK